MINLPQLISYFPFLTARWEDAAAAYLSESWKRHVMWYVKDDSRLGFLDMDKKLRISETFSRTEVSRKLLAFQVRHSDVLLSNH